VKERKFEARVGKANTMTVGNRVSGTLEIDDSSRNKSLNQIAMFTTVSDMPLKPDSTLPTALIGNKTENYEEKVSTESSQNASTLVSRDNTKKE
jgi:hypothetical protein